MTWTRENDVLIATKAEGLTVVTEDVRSVSGNEYRIYYVGDATYPTIPSRLVDAYNRDDAATLRAMRAWVDQDKLNRQFEITYAPVFGCDALTVTLHGNGETYEGYGNAPTIALAGSAALLKALGGGA